MNVLRAEKLEDAIKHVDSRSFFEGREMVSVDSKLTCLKGVRTRTMMVKSVKRNLFVSRYGNERDSLNENVAGSRRCGSSRSISLFGSG